ncbi:MAG TPA: hemolysin family protein [Chloroflexota bacterium]|nr:hemolysin family protein [Chloroflexota bacterium]
MDVSSGLGLIAVVALVLANGFFVATEFAIVAVRRSRLEQLAREGHAAARAARDVVGHLDAYIAACQLGITMASLALGWIGEPALAHLVEPPLERLVGQFAPAAAHGVAIGVSFALITALHIVLGELAPKGLALQRAESTALWVARPMQAFYVVFRWPILTLNAIGNGVLRLVGLPPAAGHEMVHSVEELRLLVTSSQQAGVVEASEARIASRAFQFADRTAGALMTPRTELEAVPITISLDALLAVVLSGTHNRLVVYQDTLDDVQGVLYVRDLLKVVARPGAAFDLRALLRPVLTVPASKPANALLEEMQAARRQLAVVLDEYGGTAGIITIEDLVEALVGRIDDEPAPGEVSALIGPDVPLRDGSLVLDGLMRLDELEELTGLRLAPEDHELVETVGGLVMARLGRIPDLGDEVEVAGRTLRVERRDGRRVAAVRLGAATPAREAVAGGAGAPGGAAAPPHRG